jgi:hypothetical protein
MARKLDSPPNATVFLAILLTALVMSAVLTRARAQTPPITTPPAATALESERAVTPRSEAEASCRAIGNPDQRTQCLAELNRDAGGPLKRDDTVPPPPAELKQDSPLRNDAPSNDPVPPPVK